MQKKFSRVRFLLHNHTFFKTVYAHFFRKHFENVVRDQNYRANKLLNYKFDCSKPRTFNEYIVWIKLNYRNELWKRCADKIESKKFLSSIGLGDYLPKTFGIYNHSNEINLDMLPDKFVLKTNHDCGTVFICEKGVTDFKRIFKKLDDALCTKYSNSNEEWVYENIKPRIFAEELLIPNAHIKELVDYKFFMFAGEIGFGFTAQNRFKDTRFTLFDKNFNPIPCEYVYLKPAKKDWPVKPKCWDEMMDICNKISKHFEFVRVDLYWTNNGPRIGELTFFSQGGMGPFTKKKYDFEFGKLFEKTAFYKMTNHQK